MADSPGHTPVSLPLRLLLSAFLPVVFGWFDVPVASEEKPPPVPFEGAVSTDWYKAFAAWDQANGDRYLDGRDGGSFAWGPSAYVQRMYLNLYRTFKEPVWLDKLVEQVDRILDARSDVPAYEVYDPRYVDGYAGSGQNRYRQYRPEYTEWFSDDGLIISPILAFVELVWEDPALHAAYRTKADEYLRAVEEDVIAKWYANWTPDPGWTAGDSSRHGEDAGYHVYEWSGWKRQPLNMYLSFADGLVTLRRLSRSPYYKTHKEGFSSFYADHSERMLQHFHDQLLYDSEVEAYTWKYGPGSHWPDLMEDVGHAFIDIQAALQGVRSGLSFTRMDLERMANTFVRHVWNGSLEAPSFRYYIGGPASKLDAERGWRGWGFLYLAGYDYRIWESMAAYFEKEITIQASPAHVAATAAMLGIATQAYDRWPPGAPRHVDAERSGKDVRVSWGRPETDADGTALTGLKGYFVYRATGPGGPFTPLNETSLVTTRYVDPGAASGSFFYRITAVDYRRPANEGPPSATASAL
ncbi:MAG: hypothetical protein OXU79_07200 [Gemmatimonadota bacterium]|nr:hypothetical protein [Gemmatimonadota bacterium]